ncbi:MAG: C-GCAxxG-C-C family protein [Chthoniobacteraceae bacterium]
MKSRSDIAEEKLVSGYNCAQAVLYSMCDKVGMDAQTALKLATGFGGGIARGGHVCGAVSGGIFALGLCLGRGENADKTATEYTYARVQELMATVQAKFGSCLCRDLLEGRDLNSPEDKASYQAADCLHKTCVPLVRAVVEYVEERV